MKKLLFTGLVLFICSALHAQLIITTNVGDFKFDETTNTIDFNGIHYTVSNIQNSNSGVCYFFCNNYDSNKMFEINIPNSQIIEYNPIELYKRGDIGMWDKNKLVRGLYNNIDTYIANNNLSGNKANHFRSLASQAIEGIKNGTTIYNNDGTFTDTTGKLASTGNFDRGFLGSVKDTPNNIANLVGDYINKYISGMPTCNNRWEQVNEPYKIYNSTIKPNTKKYGGKK